MVNLDDIQIYDKIEPENMRGHLHALPQQCRSAWDKATKFKLPKDYADVDKVVILGMGGSAIGGDLVRSLFLSQKKPIIFVSREYELPAFVDDHTLVIASSYSGNTEETLSAFSQSLKKKCKKLAMTTGGELKGIAERTGVPVFVIDYKGQPRAAVGYGVMSLIAFLQTLRLVKNQSSEVESMTKELDRLIKELQETVPGSSNRAKQLAAKFHGKLAVIYGAGILSEVAHRWKTQINENGKSWAFYETFSELDHNSIVGYQFPRELVQSIYVVMLRSSVLNPRIMLRYRITGELLEQNGIGHETVESRAKGALSQMMGLIYLGDWVSYYIAILNEIDPTPVKVIEYLKKRLSEVKKGGGDHD